MFINLNLRHKRTEMKKCKVFIFNDFNANNNNN